MDYIDAYFLNVWHRFKGGFGEWFIGYKGYKGPASNLSRRYHRHETLRATSNHHLMALSLQQWHY